jgi:hypothetical protein
MCQRCGNPLNTGTKYCSRRCAILTIRANQPRRPKPKAQPKPKTKASRAGVTGSQYLKDAATLRARAKASNLPCWICHHPIDWTAKPRTRWSFSADHRDPRSKGGAHTLANLIQAHYGCNASRGNGTRRPIKATERAMTRSDRW